MPPEQADPTSEELQWLNDFMAYQAKQLAQTSGAEAVQGFAKAMGGAAPEIQQAWLESEQSAVEEAASVAAGPAEGEATGTAATGTQGSGEDLETIAGRIYAKAVDELRGDGMTLDDADLAGIWQDAWSAASSVTPETEEQAVKQVTDSFTMKIMEDDDVIDLSELYQAIASFLEDVRNANAEQELGRWDR